MQKISKDAFFLVHFYNFVLVGNTFSEYLKTLKVFTLNDPNKILTDLDNTGWIMRDYAILNGIKVHPLLGYTIKKRQRNISTSSSKALHLNFYNKLAWSIYNHLLVNVDGEEQKKGIRLIKLQYSNLLESYIWGVQKHNKIAPIYMVLDEFLELENMPTHRLHLASIFTRMWTSIDFIPTKLQIEYIGMMENMATIYMENHSYREAKELLLQTYEMYKTYFPNEGEGLVAIMHNLGVVSSHLEEFDEGKEWFRESLILYEDQNDEEAIARLNLNLGVINISLKSYEKAISYLEKAETKYSLLKSYPNLADTYYNMGVAQEKIKEYDKSLDYYYQSLAIIKIYPKSIREADISLRVGTILMRLGNQDLAEVFYKNALVISIRLNNKIKEGEAYRNLGVLLRNNEQWEEGNDYYKKALRIFAEFKQFEDINKVLFDLTFLSPIELDDSLHYEVIDILGDYLSVMEVEQIIEQLAKKRMF